MLCNARTEHPMGEEIGQSFPKGYFVLNRLSGNFIHELLRLGVRSGEDRWDIWRGEGCKVAR
jgi:hypothetical protein